MSMSFWCMVVLVVLSPYAMSFRPYEKIYELGVNQATHVNDIAFTARLSLIVVGFALSASSALELAMYMFRRQKSRSQLAVLLASFAACCVIGFRSFPYWVTGVYATLNGTSPLVDMDPKWLLPFGIWLDVWRMSVLALYVLAVSTLIFCTREALSLWRHGERADAATIFIPVCVIVFFLIGFSPGYVNWLMD